MRRTLRDRLPMFTRPPKRPYRVAIEGFSEFERSALASFFRLADRRVPAYEPVDSPDHSDFLIADADQPRVLDWVARERRAGDTVFVGAQAPDDAVAWLVRPIEPVHIMRALDGLLGERAGTPSAKPARPAPAPTESPTESPAESPKTAAAEPKRRPNPTTTPRGGAGRAVLVADPSPIARAFLAQRLRRLGYRVTLAASGEEALEAAGHLGFHIVFVDAVLGAPERIDGLQVCQQLKQRTTQPDGVVPAVVITAGSAGATDRVRGSLAGCDAYLTKPLMAADFSATLQQVDPLFGWAAWRSA